MQRQLVLPNSRNCPEVAKAETRDIPVKASASMSATCKPEVMAWSEPGGRGGAEPHSRRPTNILGR